LGVWWCRLVVSESEAMELFKENPFKQRFISEALARGGPHVQLTAYVHTVGSPRQALLAYNPARSTHVTTYVTTHSTKGVTAYVTTDATSLTSYIVF
jgi:hypothetical protein